MLNIDKVCLINNRVFCYGIILKILKIKNKIKK